jgi:hypothetical protein
VLMGLGGSGAGWARSGGSRVSSKVLTG